MKSLKYILIAAGGYKPEIRKIKITEKDIKNILDDEPDLEDGEAINIILDEYLAEYSQMFVNAIILSEDEFNYLKKQLLK